MPAVKGARRGEIPRLVAAGLAITWRAGRRVLAAVLATQHPGAGLASPGLSSVWPSAVLLGIITAVLGLAGVVIREQQRILSELTSRYAQDRILDVTCEVELAAFDQPEFHDRAARAQVGVMRAPQMVFGLQGLARSMAGAIGAAAALITVAPLLIPVALVALIPGWIASGRRGRVLRFRRRHDAAGPRAQLPGRTADPA